MRSDRVLSLSISMSMAGLSRLMSSTVIWLTSWVSMRYCSQGSVSLTPTMVTCFMGAGPGRRPA